MIKYDCCPKCFWFDVSLNVWLTFECKEEDKEAKIQEIKKRKCQECIQESNFSAKWLCRKCETQIDSHNYLLHGELCDSCWENEVNAEK